MKTITKLTLAITAAVVLAAGLPSANATIICNSWSQGGSSGSQLFTYNFQSQTCGGNFANYYTFNQNNDQLSCNYTTGPYSGLCNVIIDCLNGQSYFCSISNWDGHTAIQCQGLPTGCKNIRVCTPVPEPSTIAAGALLLLPVGVSMLRILRRNKTRVAA